MELKSLVEEIRRIMYVRNVDQTIREGLVRVVENAWHNIEEAKG